MDKNVHLSVWPVKRQAMKVSLAIFVVASIIAVGIINAQPWNEPSGKAVAKAPQTGEQESTKNVKNAKPKLQLEKATNRTRRTVKMLDDIYKGGIVTITDKYVTKDSEIPAGTAFKQIFAIAKEKGWHEARLLDVTGDPYNSENVAVDEFEKRAVKKIVSGDSFYEEVEEADGQKYFRAMTPIPVVFEKCTWCHSNYEDIPAGKAIGAMSYKVKIDLE